VIGQYTVVNLSRGIKKIQLVESAQDMIMDEKISLPEIKIQGT
jgi:hypothetical protein